MPSCLIESLKASVVAVTDAACAMLAHSPMIAHNLVLAHICASSPTTLAHLAILPIFMPPP
jgi:hypothetical protein